MQYCDVLRTDPRHLQGRTFDLVVVGGGIQGAAIAREAALRQLRVLLVDAGDFANGTSSRSSRLVHGGLRYLRQGRFQLVREALGERERLLRLCPHLVRPAPMLLPFFRGDRAPWLVKLGVRLYAQLAGRSTLPGPQALDAETCQAAFAGLRTHGLRGGLSFFDAVTEDARLSLAVVQAAVDAGALVVNHCVAADHKSGALLLFDGVSGDAVSVHPRIIVNATGPRVDAVRAAFGLGDRPLLRLSRGAHLVFAPRAGEGGLCAFLPDGRVQFVIPHMDGTIAGTTETDDDARDGEPTVAATDVAYLLDALGQLLEPAPTRAEVLFAYAGWRALPAVAGPAGGIHREAFLVKERIGQSEVYSVVGGKLTTHRSFAERAVQQMCGASPPSPSRTQTLPGGDGPREVRDPLWWRHGSLMTRLRQQIAVDPALGEALCPHRPFLVVEAVHALQHQATVTFADLMLRRLNHSLGPCLQDACLMRAHALFLQHRQWPLDDGLHAAIVALRAEVRHLTGGIVGGDGSQAMAAPRLSSHDSDA